MNNQPEGNFYDKYSSGNIIEKMIMQNFFKTLKKTLKTVPFNSILEAGCGEGIVTSFVKNEFKSDIDAFDVSESVISKAAKDFPDINFFTDSIYEMTNTKDTYDLVMAIEVLEHLEAPEKAIKSLLAKTNKFLLVSVPREPLWCFLNMCRFKYIKDFGNTPGHIQHWSRKSFIAFCSKHAKIIKIYSPLPWTMVLLEKI